MGKSRHILNLTKTIQQDSVSQPNIDNQRILKRLRRKTGKNCRKKITKIIHNCCVFTKLSNGKILKTIKQSYIQIYETFVPDALMIKARCD
jgi:hypothetical protein